MKNVYLAFLLTILLATTAFAEININTAVQKELTVLSGIGPTKAEAIVKYRKANGLFKNISELKNVKGIGEKTFEKIQGEITLEEKSAKKQTVTEKEQTGTKKP